MSTRRRRSLRRKLKKVNQGGERRRGEEHAWPTEDKSRTREACSERISTGRGQFASCLLALTREPGLRIMRRLPLCSRSAVCSKGNPFIEAEMSSSFIRIRSTTACMALEAKRDKDYDVLDSKKSDKFEKNLKFCSLLEGDREIIWCGDKK